MFGQYWSQVVSAAWKHLDRLFFVPVLLCSLDLGTTLVKFVAFSGILGT